MALPRSYPVALERPNMLNLRLFGSPLSSLLISGARLGRSPGLIALFDQTNITSDTRVETELFTFVTASFTPGGPHIS